MPRRAGSAVTSRGDGLPSPSRLSRVLLTPFGLSSPVTHTASWRPHTERGASPVHAEYRGVIPRGVPNPQHRGFVPCSCRFRGSSSELVLYTLSHVTSPRQHRKGEASLLHREGSRDSQEGSPPPPRKSLGCGAAALLSGAPPCLWGSSLSPSPHQHPSRASAWKVLLHAVFKSVLTDSLGGYCWVHFLGFCSKAA